MQRLRDLAMSESGFVFDPFSGTTYTANPSALCMLEGLKRGLSRAAVLDRVLERFETDGEDLSRDLDDLVQSLRLYGLVPADFTVSSSTEVK